jgi:hypothetical protein
MVAHLFEQGAELNQKGSLALVDLLVADQRIGRSDRALTQDGQADSVIKHTVE